MVFEKWREKDCTACAARSRGVEIVEVRKEDVGLLEMG